MEKSRRRTLIALPLAVLLAAAGCTRKDPSPMAPDNAAEGERMMRQMSELLAKTPAFRFTTSETLEPAGGPAGGRILRFTRTVTVRRPSAMFFELDGTGDTAADVSAFYDGKAVSLRNNADGHWAQTPVPATLDGMLDDVAKRYHCRCRSPTWSTARPTMRSSARRPWAGWLDARRSTASSARG